MTALGDHFAQGRLEPHEFEERVTTAYAARTAHELDRLFDDLPAAGTPRPPTPPRGEVRTGHDTVPHLGTYPLEPGPVPYDPAAPFGREPRTGQPYSDRSKVVAGVLQLIMPIGIGRLYSGQVAIGVAQLLLAFFGIGVLWAFLDGIVILAGRPTDGHGRPLHP